MAPILIDTHTHLYSSEFESDIDAVIARAQQDHVQKFYLPAIDSNSLDAMLGLEKKYPDVDESMTLEEIQEAIADLKKKL